MKLPKRPEWENLICRFMTAAGIPAFTYNAGTKRFQGIKGYSFVRVMPHHEGGWAKLPGYFHRYETERSQNSPHPVVMFATSRRYGPNIEDTFVITRLDTFAQIMSSLVEADPARHLGKE
jgi:hypothetical protein